MKRFVFYIITALVFFAFPADAESDPSIFVVQSSRISPYEEALAGFRESCARLRPRKGLKSIQPLPVTEAILTGKFSGRNIRKKIAAEKPSLIIAIGTNALDAVKTIKNIPIVYLMVPFPETLTKGRKNITGVTMTIPPTRQIKGFKKALPKLKRLGTIFDPNRTGKLVKSLTKAGAQNNISIVAKKTSSAKDVDKILSDLSGTIDAFLMLPDVTIITPETLDLIFLYSLENRVPVLTFSEKYLKSGAALAVTSDNFKMGVQAGELAKKIFTGQRVADLPPEKPKDIKIVTNSIIMKKLGLVPNADSNASGELH